MGLVAVRQIRLCRQSDKILKSLKIFKSFSDHNVKISRCLAKVLCYFSVINVFLLVSWVKYVVRDVVEARMMGHHVFPCQSIPLNTT